MHVDRTHRIHELMRALRTIRRHMAPGAVGHGRSHITPAQWGVLMLIAERRECTVKDIANALRITSSAATQLVGALVVGGYVVRKESAADRRAVTLSLSSQAKAKMKSIKSSALEKMLELFVPLSDQELANYVALNKKIATHLSEQHA